ncbi:MAG: quinolinate synthase NadA [Ruminococcaceae bacterium]|nr:quinolinate synthase NadA [Oscillospiraceae bacterium]
MENSIKNKISELKAEKNAVILAHYYTSDDVQALADYVGDSFYLAKIAKQSDADVIVFCGVSFMGESAKILNPNKTVLMPDLSADCPMAHMVKPGKIDEMRREYDDLAVVCYINSTAELKCQSDVCVTSSNAIKIVRSLPQKNIFFIPDKNLGRYVKEMVPEKNVILNDGCCPIHAAMTADDIKAEIAKHPDALVVAHPECEEEVLLLSDYIGSTAEIISYVKDCDRNEFIVGTEVGVAYRLREDNPGKSFYFTERLPCCVDMKLNTPERILHVLATGENEVIIKDDIIERALVPLDRMLDIAK